MLWKKSRTTFLHGCTWLLNQFQIHLVQRMTANRQVNIAVIRSPAKFLPLLLKPVASEVAEVLGLAVSVLGPAVSVLSPFLLSMKLSLVRTAVVAVVLGLAVTVLGLAGSGLALLLLSTLLSPPLAMPLLATVLLPLVGLLLVVMSFSQFGVVSLVVLLVLGVVASFKSLLLLVKEALGPPTGVMRATFLKISPMPEA
jgi:hypothetical protein